VKNVSRFISFVTLAAVLLLGACNKKPLPVPPPPSPPAPSPTASLTANPNSVQKGESTTLTWETTNADDVQIDGIGPVNRSGSRQVTPTDSVTYRLVAKGAGGSQQEATARVTVNTPPPPVTPTETTGSLTEEQMFDQSVKDIYFDYDKYDVSPAQQSSVQTTAQFLAAHPGIHFSVEGHCDERGSTEFNLALGDNRANAVKTALIQAGVAADRIRTISYGKEKPFCAEHTEDCWQQNRRGHFVYQK
jgi:peptidoglycan-associated lipoprotein